MVQRFSGMRHCVIPNPNGVQTSSPGLIANSNLPWVTSPLDVHNHEGVASYPEYHQANCPSTNAGTSSSPIIRHRLLPASAIALAVNRLFVITAHALHR